MSGIAAGAAAIVGVSLGWWGAAALGLIVLAIVFALAAGKQQNLPWTPCLIALVAVALGAWRTESPPFPHRTAIPVVEVHEATVVDAPIHAGRFQLITVQARSQAPRESLRLCATGEAHPVVGHGDVLTLRGEVLGLPDLSRRSRAYLQSRGCNASMDAEEISLLQSGAGPARALSEMRTRLGAVLQAVAPGDAGVLLTGLVTGDDSGFSRDREEAFERTNTTHLTAVSGSNLALVAGIMATVGVATVGRHRIAWQAITVVAVWAYALVSGAQPPAVRAAIVATAAILAFRFGRRPDFPTLIVLAAGGMVLIEPAQISALGFRLSVAASLALAWVLPEMLNRGRASPLASLVAAAAAAQLATIPLLLPVFGSVSLVSLPANVLAMPLVAIAMPLALLAALLGLASLPLAAIIGAPATYSAMMTIELVDWLGGEGSSIQAGTPPPMASVAIAATCFTILIVMGSPKTGHRASSILAKLKASGRRSVDR